MPKFEIKTKRSRQLLMSTEARDAEHALQQLAWKSGYNSFGDLAVSMERSVDQAQNDLIVEEVGQVRTPRSERIKKLPLPPRRIAA